MAVVLLENIFHYSWASLVTRFDCLPESQQLHPPALGVNRVEPGVAQVAWDFPRGLEVVILQSVYAGFFCR